MLLIKSKFKGGVLDWDFIRQFWEVKVWWYWIETF